MSKSLKKNIYNYNAIAIHIWVYKHISCSNQVLGQVETKINYKIKNNYVQVWHSLETALRECQVDINYKPVSIFRKSTISRVS